MWLAPGAHVPIVFGHMCLTFSAGSTTYEVYLFSDEAPFLPAGEQLLTSSGDSTIGVVPLTPSQKLLILALAETRLSRIGSGAVEVPSSSAAAARLGWGLTRFTRKLDNVCDKFDRIGVDGLRGGLDGYAVNRRVRLVEYAVTSLLVTRRPAIAGHRSCGELRRARREASDEAQATVVRGGSSTIW